MHRTVGEHTSHVIKRKRGDGKGRRKIFAALAVLLFAFSVIAVVYDSTDDPEAISTGTRTNPLKTLNTTLKDFGFRTPDSSNFPSSSVTTFYVEVGAYVDISGYMKEEGYGFAFKSVTADFGLRVDSSYSLVGTISKAGDITVTACSCSDSGSTSGDYACSKIVAIQTKVLDISISSSVSSGKIATGGTVTLTAKTTPTTAKDPHVTWTIQSGSQYGEITRTTNTTTGGTCTVKGTGIGEVVIRCDSVDDNASTIYRLTVTQRMATSVALYQGFANGDDLIVTADVFPTDAWDQRIEFSLIKGSNLVRMESSNVYTNDGEVKLVATGSGSGEITIRASALDGSGCYNDRTFYVAHVSFNANGGSGAPSDIYKVTGSTYPMGYLPSKEPSRSGYAFMGWSTSRDGSSLEDAGGYASLKDGTTYYAIWGKETYIDYTVNQGTGGPKDETVIVMENDSDWYRIPSSDSSIPKRPGFTFLGWSTYPGASSAQYKPGDGMDIYAGETYQLYDVWTITENEYHLSYDANGGTNAPGTQDGTNYGLDNTYIFVVTGSEPTYEGHLFLGWSTTASSTVEYDAGSKITIPIGTTTLYAVWQVINTFRIAYDANGGTNAPVLEKDTYETVNDTIQIQISRDRPVWDEFHAFLGWSTDPQATSATILPGSMYVLTIKGTTTFYAVWEEIEGNTFVLHFDLQGGQKGPEDVTSITVRDESTISIPSDVPEWDRYKLFLGWSTSAGGDTVLQPGAQITLTESETTLYAVWQRLPMPYILHFELNGGTWNSCDQTGSSPEDICLLTIPDTTPSKEGFGFRGWSPTEDGTVEYRPGEMFTAHELNSTLYAVWQELDLFTLMFNTNGGSPMDNITAYSLDSCSFAIPNTVPTRDGYLFQGWARSEGGAIDCQPGQTITVTSKTTTLHAFWMERPETITFILKFDAGEGSGAPALMRKTTSDDTCSFTIPDREPVRDGYGFVGWSLSSDGTVQYRPRDTIDVAIEETILHAVWVERSNLKHFELRFNLGGGQGDFDSLTAETIDDSHAFKVPNKVPERSGYVFIGWALPTNPSFVVYNPGDSIEVSTETFTIYAVWQPESIVFSLSFDIGDGASGAPSTIREMDNATVHTFSIPMDIPSMEGYTFVGWSASFGGKVDYLPGDAIVSGTKNATLYAVWKIENDGAIHITNSPTDRTDVGSQMTFEAFVDREVPFTVSISGSAAEWLNVNKHTIYGTPSIPGTYILIVTVTDGDDYTPSTSEFTIRVMGSDVMEYRVEFNTTGGSDIDTQWVPSGGSVSIPDDPTRKDFRFLGWYTESGSRYDFDQSVGEDMTLKAVWIYDESSSDDKEGGFQIPLWAIVGAVAMIMIVATALTRNPISAIAAIVSMIATIALYIF